MATAKQKKAAQKLVENGGNVTQAMRDAGYAEASVNNPSNLTEAKGFKDLMVKMGVDDEKLITVLKEGLEATEAIVMGKDSKESFVDIIPDHKTRHKFLETGLRLAGHGKADGGNVFNFNFGEKTEPRKYVNAED